VDAPNRSSTPLSRNRDFVLLQAGQALSTVGSSMTQIAYPLLVLATTHSPAKAGVVGFANILPYALFGLLAGVAADRWNRKHLMILMDAVRALGALSIVVALALGELTFAQICIVAFVEGSAFVFFNIAEVGALRSVVPPKQLPDAAAAEQARFATVTLVGPPLGGALFGIARSLPFVADAASYLFSVGSLLWMRTPFQQVRERDTTPLRAQIREGISWLWEQKYLRTSALIFAGDNFVFQGIFLTFVVVGRRDGLSSGTIGVLIAAFGCGSLLGSLVAPRAAKALSMRTIMLLNQWLNSAFALFLLFPNAYVLVPLVLPAAFATPSLNAVVIGYRTAVTPDHLVGRVSSVARNIALLAQPLGPLVAGFLLGAFGPRPTVLVLAAVSLALATWSTVSPSIRTSPSLAELDALPAA
jgi:predicted MFS family arabinose efflux permease